MAGTVIDEKGIVYDTLYDTMRSFNMPITENDIKINHGKNKYEVLDFFSKKNILIENNLV